MTRLRSLSARQVLRILQGFGFSVVSVRGSHARLKREVEGGPPQVLTVPIHRELAIGTVLAIYRQALRFIPEPGTLCDMGKMDGMIKRKWTKK